MAPIIASVARKRAPANIGSTLHEHTASTVPEIDATEYHGRFPSPSAP